jgi:hypothetical protein
LSTFLNIFLAITFLFVTSSCNNSDKNETREKPIAIAGTEELSADELQENYINTGNPKDSVGVTKKVIEEWAIGSLFYQEALTKLNEEEVDIEQQVKAYKKTLVNYIYQTKIIEANLDTNISVKEIDQYYNDNKDNFILKDNIVKVNYFKIPLKAQALQKIKNLFYAVTPKDKEQLKNLCIQYADNFFINDSTWLYLDDIRKEIPKLKEQTDFNIYQGRIVELNDDQFYYYLKIKELKVKNGISPINFERQNIKKFIIIRRKTELIQQYKLQLLEKARTEKKFTVFN